MKRWLSPEAAAEYLDVRVDTLRRLVRPGNLPAADYSLGPRTPRYDPQLLDQAMGATMATGDPDKAFEGWVKKRREANS